MKQKTDTPKGTEHRKHKNARLVLEVSARVKANGSFTVLLGMEARAVTESKNK